MTEHSSSRFKIELVKATFSESVIPMFWCDNHNFLMFNDSFASITGYSEDELHEIGFDDLSDAKNSFNSIEEIHTTPNGREVHIITWQLIRKDGKKEVLELRLTRVLQEEGNSFFYGVLRQMSEPRADQEIFSDVITKLQDSLSASNQGVWEWYGSSNHAALLDTHIGLSEQNMQVVDFDQELFLGKVHPVDRPRVKINWEQMTKSPEDRYQDEYRILSKAQKYVWVRSEGKVMERNKDGEPLRISGIIRNINEEKETERKIQAQTQKLIDYAFMNSHLLRGPASSILGLVDLLADEHEGENLNRLREAALKLDERIHEINSMIEAKENTNGVINAHVQRVSLISKDSLQSLILKNTIEEISLEMKFDLSEDLEEFTANPLEEDHAEIVILDDDSCPDTWNFLTEFEEAHPHVPIYLLASRFDVKMIDRLNTDTSVHGIILKSEDQRGLLEFLKSLNG
ncbi:MAG: PAS domain-containing protein [Bacteroidota bacterium]